MQQVRKMRFYRQVPWDRTSVENRIYEFVSRTIFLICSVRKIREPQSLQVEMLTRS